MPVTLLEQHVSIDVWYTNELIPDGLQDSQCIPRVFDIICVNNPYLLVAALAS